MKKIRFHPNVPAEVRAIEQRAVLGILRAIIDAWLPEAPALIIFCDAERSF